ncbi:Vms1/Ankzf1 family peptidyl-tRNA hydrolase [Lapillicoccus sp.]|uniref:Vms1/Ankzf1 family peptidyl-tRNA hydrolase n=1 Tax=Lapillicoccus sp. TaxID=1909287 RepID=UPI003982D846
MTTRLIEVAPERLERWVAGFGERHDGASVQTDGVVVVSATGGDGATARFEHFGHVPLGLVLVRRGGYAVGLAAAVDGPGEEVGKRPRPGPGADLGEVSPGEGRTSPGSRPVVLVASKVGTRHVQSRTAAGGWSQQRFARRRGNQADALVEAVAGHALRILLGGDASPRRGAPGIPRGLVIGGDRALAAQVLEETGLRVLGDLPRRELYDLPDPKRAVLEEALRRGRAVRVTLTEPD